MGVVESVLCIVFFVFSIPLLIKSDEVVTGPAICSLYGFFMTLLHPIALWTVCGLNCDRYYAISAPLHYNAIVNSKKVSANSDSEKIASFWPFNYIFKQKINFLFKF